MPTPKRKASVQARRNKQGNKNPDLTLNRRRARVDRDLSRLGLPSLAVIEAAGLEKPKQTKGREAHAAASVAAPCDKDLGDQRVVIKFFYEQLGSPPEEDWAGHYGTIGQIRLRMGDAAPEARTVQRTLKRLLDGDEDIASKPSGPGAKPSLSEEEDLLVGLLATKGFSQPMALQLLNLERFEKGLEPVSLRSLQRAEARVQLMRRKRRSRKAGSTDLEGAWAKASLNQSVQFDGQLTLGYEAEQYEAWRGNPPPAWAETFDGPTVKVGSQRVKTCATDPWSVISDTVLISGTVWDKNDRKPWKCEIRGYTTEMGVASSAGRGPLCLIKTVRKL